MTDDELRIAKIEARVRLSIASREATPATGSIDGGIISKEDFETLLNSRLAWKFTAKCYAAVVKDD